MWEIERPLSRLTASYLATLENIPFCLLSAS